MIRKNHGEDAGTAQKFEKIVQHIERIGDHSLLPVSALPKTIYQSLRWMSKLNKEMSPTYIHDHIEGKAVIYHPFWVAKTLVIAERPPFPPRKQPNVIFVDAVSGYRGVFGHVPPLQNTTVDAEQLVPLNIQDQQEAVHYVQNVQQWQINRSYLLKKPKHEIKELSIAYLPLWKVRVNSERVRDTFYINANTGESEKYLSERWKGHQDLLSAEGR